jgi:hypothetical protein
LELPSLLLLLSCGASLELLLELLPSCDASLVLLS